MSDTTYPESMARLERAVQATSLDVRNERLRALRIDLDEFEASRNAARVDGMKRAFDHHLLHDEHILVRVGGPPRASRRDVRS